MSGRIYLDHNATTPIDPAVRHAMRPYLDELFGNASSIEHEDGHVAGQAVERAREQVASAIGARPGEIVFTGSCTEADNLAILGVARALSEKGHIITTAIEHPAVLEPARALEREGWEVTYLGVDASGQVRFDELRDAITERTSLVSVMAANNEVGTIQPFARIGALCEERGIVFHTDLAQLIAYGDVDVVRDHIHLASLSAHKAYGPKGVGALYVRSRKPKVRLSPIIFGGGQEKGLRPGTLDTASIVGMGEAFASARRSAGSDAARIRDLCDTFDGILRASVTDIELNGHPTERLANNLSYSIAGVEPLALMRALRGVVSFSASSACSTDKFVTSHVLLAMFGDGSRARSAFRIAPGRFTTGPQMVTAAERIVEEVLRLRSMTLPASHS